MRVSVLLRCRLQEGKKATTHVKPWTMWRSHTSCYFKHLGAPGSYNPLVGLPRRRRVRGGLGLNSESLSWARFSFWAQTFEDQLPPPVFLTATEAERAQLDSCISGLVHFRDKQEVKEKKRKKRKSPLAHKIRIFEMKVVQSKSGAPRCHLRSCGVSEHKGTCTLRREGEGFTVLN